ACIRPDDIQVVSEAEKAENTIQGRVSVRTYLGKRMQYNVETALGELIVNTSNDRLFNVGESIALSLPAGKIVLV
ncbi:MAG TPA: spermidine/putrescine ABC transporter ATP-binding protein, partial [Oribacterium sp.]|nr:spermidine/putrescine ABC transporter ATP-binding protein [Oribacterium sp.]